MARQAKPQRPKVKVSGLRYQMTVKVGGREPLFLSGSSQEELVRDLAAAAAEIDAGVEKGGRRG
jgi:hypothetical protein